MQHGLADMQHGLADMQLGHSDMQNGHRNGRRNGRKWSWTGELGRNCAKVRYNVYTHSSGVPELDVRLNCEQYTG
jgi:hypothetical protein